MLWHFHLKHPSHVKLQLIYNELKSSISLSQLLSHCQTCHMAKQRRLPFISNNHLSATPFDLIHINIWGPFHVQTQADNRFFLAIVDDYTRATWVYLLRAKTDFFTMFLEFFTLVSTQYNNVPIKFVRCDNAPELSFT